MKHLLFPFILGVSVAPFVPYTHGVANLSLAEPLIVVIFSLVLLRGRLHIPNVIWPVLVLAMMATASLIFSEFSSQSLEPLGQVARWYYFVSLLLILSNTVKNRSTFKLCLLAMLWGAIFTTAWVWYAWYQNPRYFGGVPMLHLRHEGVEHIVNRNYFGYFSSIGASMAYAYLRFSVGTSSFGKTILWGSIFLFLAISTALTFSKGSWFTVIGCVMGLEILRIISTLEHNKISSKRLLLWFFLVLMASSIVTMVYRDAIVAFLGQAVAAFDIASQTGTSEARLIYVKDAFQIMMMHPLLGVGPRSYQDAAEAMGLSATTDPHNAILWVGAELGVVSALLISGVFAHLVILLVRLRKNRDFRCESDVALMLALAVIINIALHGLPVSMKHTWILLGMLAGILRYTSGPTANVVCDSKTSSSLTRPRWRLQTSVER